MSSQIANQIKSITQSVLPTDTKIGMFGSRVQGTPSKFSDVDIAISSPSAIAGHTLELIRESFEKSNFPFKVDVIDLSQTSKFFREKVERETTWL